MTDDWLSMRVKGFEGWTPKAQWDYKQNSNGFGTRALYPGEVIDKAEGDRRFIAEFGKARDAVERFAPNADPGTKAALASLTFNSGTAWQNAGLGAAIKRGDVNTAKAILLQYNKAGGQFNPGLYKRRMAEAQWMGSPSIGAGQPGVGTGVPTPARHPGYDSRAVEDVLARDAAGQPAGPSSAHPQYDTLGLGVLASEAGQDQPSTAVASSGSSKEQGVNWTGRMNLGGPVDTTMPGTTAAAGAGVFDPAAFASANRQAAMAQMLMQRGDPSTARSPLEAVSKSLQGITGLYMTKKADEKKMGAMAQLLGGQNLSPVAQYALYAGGPAAVTHLMDLETKRADSKQAADSVRAAYAARGQSVPPEVEQILKSGNHEQIKTLSDATIKNSIAGQKDSAAVSKIKRIEDSLKQQYPGADPKQLAATAEAIADGTIKVGADGKFITDLNRGVSINAETGASTPLPLIPGAAVGVAPGAPGGGPAAAGGPPVALGAGGPTPTGAAPRLAPEEVKKNQQDMQNALEARNSLNRALASAREQYFTVPGKAANAVTNGAYAVGGRAVGKTVGDWLKADPAGFAKFSSTIEDAFNAHRKAVTGAAASEGELKMLRQTFANRDMSIAEFEGAVQALNEKLDQQYAQRFATMQTGLPSALPAGTSAIPGAPAAPSPAAPAAPAPPPAGTSGAPRAAPLPKNKAEMVPGSIYAHPATGEPYVFDGKQLHPIAAPTAAPAAGRPDIGGTE